MERTITSKGVGRVSVKPDLIVVSMTLKSKEKDYENSISLATNQIEEIRSALVNVGFNKKDLKTLDFDVDIAEKRVEDKDGDYEYVFDGYECEHRLKLEFDLDTKLLGKALSAIAACSSKPEISIGFSVKNTNTINAGILKRATQNAKLKAEILCESAGVKLGSLITIDYNWGEIDFISRTKQHCLGEVCAALPTSFDKMAIEPEDINVEDSATFVWEII